MVYFGAVVAVLVAACSASAPAPASAGPPAKVWHLAVESAVIDPDVEPPVSRVSLVITDETGAARREVIGEIQGGCSDVSARVRGEAMAPILGVDCWWAGAGVKLRFVRRGAVLNVMRAEVDEIGGDQSFEPIRRIDLPVGAAVRTDHDDAAAPGAG